MVRLASSTSGNRRDATVIQGLLPEFQQANEIDSGLLPYRSHCGVRVRVCTAARYAHLANESVEASDSRVGDSIGLPIAPGGTS